MQPLWIADQPNDFISGANTEALANIELLRRSGVEVNLVPMSNPGSELVKAALALGCKIHQYAPTIFTDKIVAAWYSVPFLSVLPTMAKPRRVLWFNTMTSVKELELANARFIDNWVTSSAYQQSMLARCLRDYLIKPSFCDEYLQPFIPDSKVIERTLQARLHMPGQGGAPTIGWIGRDDPRKISSSWFKILRGLGEPCRVVMLGFGPKCREAFKGMYDENATWLRLYAPGEISPQAFYDSADIIFHYTGGSGESFCRVAIEAFHAGVPFVCEKNYAFPEIFGDDHLLRSLMCESASQFIETLDCLLDAIITENGLYELIVNAQRDRLKKLSLNQRCMEFWKKVLS